MSEQDAVGLDERLNNLKEMIVHKVFDSSDGTINLTYTELADTLQAISEGMDEMRANLTACKRDAKERELDLAIADRKVEELTEDLEASQREVEGPEAENSFVKGYTRGREGLIVPHKCEPVAVAQYKDMGRSMWVGKLLEPMPDYPDETHCFHITTPAKGQIVFGIMAGDWEQLAALIIAVNGGPINPRWLETKAKHYRLNTDAVRDDIARHAFWWGHQESTIEQVRKDRAALGEESGSFDSETDADGEWDQSATGDTE